MKIMILTFALALIFNFSHAQSSIEEKAITEVVQKMEDAWNAHDYDFIGKYDIYAKNAMMINPVGMYWKNRDEIIKAHKIFGKLIFKNESTKNEISDIHFLAPTVALAAVNGKIKVENTYSTPDGQYTLSKGEIRNYRMSIVLIKQDNSWKITSLQVTEVNPEAAKVDPVNGQARYK